MVLFLKDHQFTFDFTSKYIPYKRKQEIRRKIVDNGGTISYILNKKTKYFVCGGSKDIGDTYKGRVALKLGIPIVSLSFVDDCDEKQKLLDSEEYLVVGKSSTKQFSSGIIKASANKPNENKTTRSSKPLSSFNLKFTRVYFYNEQSTDMPFFPATNYEIIKHAWFKKLEKNGTWHFVAVELHAAVVDMSKDENLGATFRIFTHSGVIDKSGIKDGKKECRFAMKPNDGEQLYLSICSCQSSLLREFSTFPFGVGSDKMLLTNLESQSFDKENGISSGAISLVHSVWSEAVGELSSLLALPVEQINIEDVDKAEAILLALRQLIDNGQYLSDDCKKLSDEFYSLILHNSENKQNIDNKRVLVEKQDLCQLIKDMVNVSEATNFSSRSSDAAKYRALRCHLEVLSKSTDEYNNLLNNIRSTQYSGSCIKVENIFSCHRPIESNNFLHLANKRQLYHSSRAQNFLGILSRGLLLPKLVVDDYGGERTDIGHLGTGIYFASAAGASVKYSSPGQMKGTRFMLICDVALGNVKDYTEFSTELNSPPEGCDSCHGVRRQGGEGWSDFEDEEYVIYTVKQQMIRYLVEFSLPGDDVTSLTNDLLGVTMNGENILSEPTNAPSLDENPDLSNEEKTEDVVITDIENMEDPLSKVKAGLKYEGDTLVPLQSVHIRAKLLDLCAKVVVMQVYKNPSTEPIEAKYVFPLDDMAAVCGFEAFINGKHIIGEVKEKEQAHKEYKKAISEGHGAYLMDEETPDVFTVSIGNIPSGATVLIKISYVAELSVEGDNIRFNLPGSLAPWKRDKALKDATQDVLETVEVDDQDLTLELSVQIAVEMPYDIRTMTCPTHKIRIKKTASKAVITMKQDQNLNDGFQLLIGLAEIHVPRMWVENDPEKPDKQACMLSFYPEFEAEPMNNIELVFLLDLSCSMQGTALDNAKKVVLLALHNLPAHCIFNVISFGTHCVELFPTSVLKTQSTLKEAVRFIQRCRSDMGASDLWKILKSFSMLPVRADVDVRNIFIISDGHVSEEETTLNFISSNRQHSRIFTFSVGSSANRYFMRTMAKVGAGASEYFDPQVKSKWKRKVQAQLLKSQQPVLTSVSVAWQQFDEDAPKPIQAPNQILSLFNGSRQVVYGFVPYCNQATLKAEINGKEISTTVYTSELSMTLGKTLHQLTARALINDWEDGSLATDQLHHQAVKRKQKDYIIEISKEFSVTSKFTSFVAIEHRDESEKYDVDAMPKIEEIVSHEDVDILSYIAWQDTDEELVGRESKKSVELELSSESETSSSGDKDEKDDWSSGSTSSYSSLELGIRTCSFQLQSNEEAKKRSFFDTNSDNELCDISEPYCLMKGGGSSKSPVESMYEGLRSSWLMEDNIYDDPWSFQDLSYDCTASRPTEEYASTGDLGDEYFSMEWHDEVSSHIKYSAGLSTEENAWTTSLVGGGFQKETQELSEEEEEGDLYLPVISEQESLVPSPKTKSRSSAHESIESLSKVMKQSTDTVVERGEKVYGLSPGGIGGGADLIGQMQSLRDKKKKTKVKNLVQPCKMTYDYTPLVPPSDADDMATDLILHSETSVAYQQTAKLKRGSPKHVPLSLGLFSAGKVEVDEHTTGDVPPLEPRFSPPPARLMSTLAAQFPPAPAQRPRIPRRSPRTMSAAPPQSLKAREALGLSLEAVAPPRPPSLPQKATAPVPLPLAAAAPPPPPVLAAAPEAPPAACAFFSFGTTVQPAPPPPPPVLAAPPGPPPPAAPPPILAAAPGPPPPAAPPPILAAAPGPPQPAAPLPPPSVLAAATGPPPAAPPSPSVLAAAPPPVLAATTGPPPPAAPPPILAAAPGPPPPAAPSPILAAAPGPPPPAAPPPILAAAPGPPPPAAPSPPPSVLAAAPGPPPAAPPWPVGGAAVPLPQPASEMQAFFSFGTTVQPPPPPLPARLLRSSSSSSSSSSVQRAPQRLSLASKLQAPFSLRTTVTSSLAPPLPPPRSFGRVSSTNVTFEQKSLQTSAQFQGYGFTPPIIHSLPRAEPRQTFSVASNTQSESNAERSDQSLECSSIPLRSRSSSAAPLRSARLIRQSASGLPRPQLQSALRSKIFIDKRPDELTIVSIFLLQNDEGSWNLPEPNLDKYLRMSTNTEAIVRVLKESGAMSLGPRMFCMARKMFATILVLGFLRYHFPQYFPLHLFPPFKPRKKLEDTGTSWQTQTEKALLWLKTADKSVPCLCNRLQLGNSWEDVITKFLKLPSITNV